MKKTMKNLDRFYAERYIRAFLPVWIDVAALVDIDQVPSRAEQLARVDAAEARVNTEFAHSCSGETYSACGNFSAPCNTCEAWHDASANVTADRSRWAGWQPPVYAKAYTLESEEKPYYGGTDDDGFDNDLPF